MIGFGRDGNSTPVFKCYGMRESSFAFSADGNPNDGAAERPQQQQQKPAGVKTPLMRLYELMPNRPSCDTWEDKEEKMFVASFNVSGQTFQGRGVTKQKAKHAAAEQILRDVFNVTLDSAATNTANFLPDSSASAPMMT